MSLNQNHTALSLHQQTIIHHTMANDKNPSLIDTLTNADCLEAMQQIADHSIDMVLTDLPYGSTRNKWDTCLPLDQLWEQWRRIITPRGAIVLFAQCPFDKVLGSSNLPWLRYEWIWVKEQGTGHLNAPYAPMKQHETILVFSPAAAAHTGRPTMLYHPQFRQGPPLPHTRASIHQAQLRPAAPASRQHRQRWQPLLSARRASLPPRSVTHSPHAEARRTATLSHPHLHRPRHDRPRLLCRQRQHLYRRRPGASPLHRLRARPRHLPHRAKEYLRPHRTGHPLLPRLTLESSINRNLEISKL